MHSGVWTCEEGQSIRCSPLLLSRAYVHGRARAWRRFHGYQNTQRRACVICLSLCQKSLYVHKILVSKIWFTHPPKGPQWGKLCKIKKISSKLTLLGGGAGEGNRNLMDKRFCGHLGFSDFGTCYESNLICLPNQSALIDVSL